MTTREVFAASVDHQAEGLACQLFRDGYIIIPELADPELFFRLYKDLDPVFNDAPFSSGLFYGETTKRFGRVPARSNAAARLAEHPLILAIMSQVLGDRAGLQLNLTQAIEIHPGAPVQVPHRDQEMWPVANRDSEYMVNVMWALDDFTVENGATRIWPGSNHSSAQILPDMQAVCAAAPAGSAIVFLGSTLHSGGANQSDKPRRGMIFSYCQGWLLPDENPWLAYPPEVARNFSPTLAQLVGYRQRAAGLNNFEGRCPSVLLDPDQPDFYAFTDDMSDEQVGRIQAYYDHISAQAAPMPSPAPVMDSQPGTGLVSLAEASGRQRPAVAERAPDTAELLQQMRRARESLLDPAVFGASAWDILLNLFLTGGTRSVSLSGACVDAPVSPATALRSINAMLERGILEKREDPEDRSTVYLYLTKQTRRQVEQVLQMAARL